MQRREVLKWLILAGSSVLTGCGGGSNSVLVTTSASMARVTIDGKNTKSVNINSGKTALDAIKKAFSYQKLEEATIINGTTGHWRYTVDNFEPNIFAGDYFIYSNCTIDLRLI